MLKAMFRRSFGKWLWHGYRSRTTVSACWLIPSYFGESSHPFSSQSFEIQHGLQKDLLLDQRDSVFVENLKVYGYVGYVPEERILGQKYTISYILYGTFAKSPQTDDLNDTLDYTSLNDTIENLAQQEIHLLETFADKIAQNAFTIFNRGKRMLDAIRITVKKEAPPMKQNLSAVGVSLFRVYEDYQSNTSG